MTTTVKIEAHLSSEKEVQVVITDNEEVTEEFVLQNGETAERYVYDDRAICVKEVVK